MSPVPRRRLGDPLADLGQIEAGLGTPRLADLTGRGVGGIRLKSVGTSMMSDWWSILPVNF